MANLRKRFSTFLNSRAFFQKPEQNSWHSYYEEKTDYEYNYKGLKRLGISAAIFLIVYAAQASDTRLGRETVNAVKVILTTETDYAYWLSKGKEYGSRYFPNAIDWSVIPVINNVQNAISKPADPLLYMSKPVEGKLVAKYGQYTDPVSKREMFHEGVDILAPAGSGVHSAAPGKVKLIEDNGLTGRLIILEHGQGIETVYGYLGEVLVAHGETVSQNQVIGRVGNIKRSYQTVESDGGTKPALYFEVRQEGKSIDPLTRIHEKFPE